MLNAFVSSIVRPIPLQEDHFLSPAAVEYLQPFLPRTMYHESPPTSETPIQQLLDELWQPDLTVRHMRRIVNQIIFSLPSWVTNHTEVRSIGCM